jgi:exonuclease III
LIRWQNEGKNCGGGNSFFNCGTSDSRGVGILLGKKFKENVEFFSQDNSGRILRSTLKINDSTFYISNIYAPNNGKERKSFFNAINDTLFKYTDDSDKNYSLILGGF